MKGADPKWLLVELVLQLSCHRVPNGDSDDTGLAYDESFATARKITNARQFAVE